MSKTTTEKLAAEARELGVEGASSRWKEDTLRERIAGARQPADLTQQAQGRPVQETTEPTKVEANSARNDVDGNQTAAGIVTQEQGNPGEVETVDGKQDRDFTHYSRERDKSDDYTSVMVTNAEAGVFNQPGGTTVDEIDADGNKKPAKRD